MDGAMRQCSKFHFIQYLFLFLWNGTNFFFKSSIINLNNEMVVLFLSQYALDILTSENDLARVI